MTIICILRSDTIWESDKKCGIFWECLFQIGKWFSNSSQLHPVIDHKSTAFSSVRSTHNGLTSSTNGSQYFWTCWPCASFAEIYDTLAQCIHRNWFWGLLALMFFEGDHFWRLSVAFSQFSVVAVQCLDNKWTSF